MLLPAVFCGKNFANFPPRNTSRRPKNGLKTDIQTDHMVAAEVFHPPEGVVDRYIGTLQKRVNSDPSRRAIIILVSATLREKRHSRPESEQIIIDVFAAKLISVFVI